MIMGFVGRRYYEEMEPSEDPENEEERAKRERFIDGCRKLVEIYYADKSEPEKQAMYKRWATHQEGIR